jgi:nitrogen fixation/metabolism regulation signal transduction histidine kinase
LKYICITKPSTINNQPSTNNQQPTTNNHQPSTINHQPYIEMKIKTKLNAGVGLLFLMIMLLAVLGGWYINKLKKDTNNILVANYNTLEYSRNMLLALENAPTDTQSFLIFQKHLTKQQNNVTEAGEKEMTDSISAHFEMLKTNPSDFTIQSKIRKDITALMELNMNAIERKSEIADATANNAIVVISATGMLCFLIAFILLVNLPSNIADPIKILTESIRQIANQNYKERIHFESHSEFGDLAKSFNVMAEKLQEYSESKIDKILQGKKRIETLIDKMNNPVIGIDEENKILFVNDEAIKIIGLKKDYLIGKLIQDVAVVNDLVIGMLLLSQNMPHSGRQFPILTVISIQIMVIAYLDIPPIKRLPLLTIISLTLW